MLAEISIIIDTDTGKYKIKATQGIKISTIKEIMSFISTDKLCTQDDVIELPKKRM